MTDWICEGWARLRDSLAHKVMRFTLNNIATSDYQTFITGSIRYGMAAAARDVETGAPSPPTERWARPERLTTEELNH